MQTIQAIRDHQFVGSFYSDSEAFAQIDTFAADESKPLAERAEALRIMATKGMGLEGENAGADLTDEELIAEFMASRDE